MYLTDVAELLQGCDAFPHNWDFSRAIVNRSDANGAGVTSVNGALIVLHWDELAFVIEYRPILLKKVSDGGAYGRIEVCKI